MFDNLFHELEKLEGSFVSISVPIDGDGYLDRRCPSETCQADFKVLMED